MNDFILVSALVFWMGINLYLIWDLKQGVKNSINSIRKNVLETRKFIKE